MATLKYNVESSQKKLQANTNVESIHEERKNQLPLEILNLMFLMEDKANQ